MRTPTTLYYPRSDDDQKSGEHLNIRNVWFGFVGTASTHGIVPIYTSVGCFKKCAWVIAFLACTGGLGYQFYLITSLYLKFNVTPVITKQSARQLEFPAVSVCNTNPVRASALHLSPTLQALIDSWQKKSRKKRDVQDSSYENFDNSEVSKNGKHRVKRSVNGNSTVPYTTMSQTTESTPVNYYGNFSVTYTTMTQTTAKSQCAASCATCRLADMESAAEQQRILAHYECDGYADGWIGLERSGSSFYWIQDNRAAWGASDWTDWYPGEPTYGNSYCHRIRHSDGRVADRQCYRSYGYICEGDFESPCEPNPCENGGTCCVVDMNAKCGCQAGFTGSNCSINTTTTTSTTTTTTAPTTTTTTINVPLTTAQTTTRAPSSFPDKEPLREDFIKETEALETIANLPEEIKRKIGYELYQLVLSCQYENEQCNMTDFAQFFDAVHGNCYVFNSGWVTEGIHLPARRPGRSKGLKMTFNLGQDEYISGIAGSAGIVVVVHPQTRMPFPEDEGVFAAPGYLTSIGLNKVSVSRLSQPYGNCSEETHNQDINVYEEFYNVEYSTTACYKTCYQKYVTQRCNCTDPQYPSKGQAFGGTNWTACSVRNVTQDDCVYGVSLDYISDSLKCDCPIPCKDTSYRYSISRSQWPSNVYEDEFLKIHADSLPNVNNYSSTKSFLDHNIVNIEVYFNEFNYQSISEKPGYPIYLYLADWCSILGLWLGMSLFSLTEFLELAADLVIVACCKIKKKPVEKKTSESNDEDRKDSQSFLIRESNRRISTVSQQWADPVSPSKYSELVKRHSSRGTSSSVNSTVFNYSSVNTPSRYSNTNTNLTSPSSSGMNTSSSNETFHKRRKYGTADKPKLANLDNRNRVTSTSDINLDSSTQDFSII